MDRRRLRVEIQQGNAAMDCPTTAIVIAGCTPTGAYLASKLYRDGHAVGIVDRDDAAFLLLSEDFAGRRVCGEPLDPSVLEQAGIANNAIFIATTPKDDLNLALGIVGRRTLGVEHVLVQVKDPKRETSLIDFGAMTICTTSLAAQAFMRRIEDAWDQNASGRKHGGKMKTLFVVVVGCGRLGSHLANLLSHEGHRVVVVDKDERSFRKLASDLYSGAQIAGDASEPAVLRQARVGDADLLITATHDDNVNLMVALVAKKILGAKNVMARVYDPAREELYHDLGLETVCPTLIAGEAFFKLLYHAIDNGGSAR